MGIDVHGLNLLRFAAVKRRFGRVATIGRQGLNVPREKVSQILGVPQDIDFGQYCEDLLKTHFGSESVDSFDYSSYEGATQIADMNQPLAGGNNYDTIIDFGCLEHIFNAPQALKNLSDLCAPGGQILHVLPANNFCGHGFWQFSPELFFSLYSEANGYSETQVFIADLSNENCWYEVRRPSNGERANVTSCTSLYNLVRTRKAALFSHENIQQSDYVHTWGKTELADPEPEFRTPGSRTKKAVDRLPFGSFARLAYRQVKKTLHLAHRQEKKTLPQEASLLAKNPHLTKHVISDLMSG